MQLGVGARSDTGLVRENNEDRFAVDLSLNLYILCDGMGGQAAGEVASQLGVDITLEHCRQAARNLQLALVGEYRKDISPATNRLASAIRLSNQAIHEAAAAKPSTSGMGSTIVAAQVNGNVLSFAHVGDSRIYFYRDGQLRQLTQDHSLVMEQVRRGFITEAEAAESAFGNVIIRALGAEATVEVDLDELWLRDNDQILLCSDGLTRMVSDALIAQVLDEPGTPQQACEHLVELANEHGGEDNITVVLVRVMPSQPIPFWRRLASFFSGGNRVWPN